MRTLRSHGYYIATHGKCIKKEWCSRQNYIDGATYCQDNNGEYSDYCGFFTKPEFIGVIIWTIPKAECWNDLKQMIKDKYNAVFVMPVGYEDKKFTLKNPNSLINGFLDVEAVMYTTDEKISERYGTKMDYYTYKFLSNVFKNEIKCINGE